MLSVSTILLLLSFQLLVRDKPLGCCSTVAKPRHPNLNQVPPDNKFPAKAAQSSALSLKP